MALKHVHTDDAPAAIGPYSQGVIVNGMLFTAGQIALDPATGQMSAGDVREQAELVMRNLTAVITAAGATSDQRTTRGSKRPCTGRSIRKVLPA